MQGGELLCISFATLGDHRRNWVRKTGGGKILINSAAEGTMALC